MQTHDYRSSRQSRGTGRQGGVEGIDNIAVTHNIAISNMTEADIRRFTEVLQATAKMSKPSNKTLCGRALLAACLLGVAITVLVTWTWTTDTY